MEFGTADLSITCVLEKLSLVLSFSGACAKVELFQFFQERDIFLCKGQTEVIPIIMSLCTSNRNCSTISVFLRTSLMNCSRCRKI